MELNQAAISPKNKRNSRNSAVECLKILGMVLIVLSHVVQTLHSGNTYVGYQDYVFPLGVATSDPKILILNILRYSGVFGNAIFFVSSAWYLLDSKTASGKKIVSMLVEIWSISVLIMAVFGVAHQGNLSLRLVIKALFPTTFSLNWYLTCYILFYAIHPFLNQVIGAMNRRTLLRCAVAMSTLYIFVNFVIGEAFQTTNLILWVSVYFCMAYMKRCLYDASNRKLYNWLLILVGIGGNCLIVILTNFLGLHHIWHFSNQLLRWNENCNPFLIMAAIGMFNLARCSNFKNTLINKISGLSLLIYIVHENIFMRTYLRPYIWQRIYETFGYEHILLWTVIQVVVIFAASLIICSVYKLTLQKTVNKLSRITYRGFCKVYGLVEDFLMKDR